ncbi:MAG: putative topoisomerase [Alphaproteobacteria bacterium]|jgi:DNA topoisomerase-1|nr:putative topoisomerase [Alphaproteobacteria bacterium]
MRGNGGRKRRDNGAASETDATSLLEQVARADARDAGLLYVTGSEPGYSRVRTGKSFSYRDIDGRPLKDKAEIARVRKLAIPPAYTDVWICASPRGHIQATGRDARGRKQYRYHEKWRATRDATKFDHILDFADNLPTMRARVLLDLRRQGLPREKVLATIVFLLENTLARIGNEEYARSNRSYGLTTLRDRHVAVEGSSLRFNFMGKSGKEWKLKFTDRRVARIVRACQELPGQHLFQYIDDEGQRQKITSADLNDYLREIAGDEVTAKDFRTWAGTVLAAMALAEFEQFDSKAAAQRNLRQAIEHVARQLGNTPTICRKCYIHPEILSCYLEGTLIETLQQRIKQALRREEKLKPEEAAVLAVLRTRLEEEARRKAKAA